MRKKKNKVTVKQSFIDEFDKKYTQNCNQKFVRTKNRNVSKDNPFDPHNKPPAQHLLPEKILDKPGAIDVTTMDASKIPLAGRLGELGLAILKAGPKAKHITTGPWNEEQFREAKPRTIRGRLPPKQMAEKINLH